MLKNIASYIIYLTFFQLLGCSEPSSQNDYVCEDCLKEPEDNTSHIQVNSNQNCTISNNVLYCPFGNSTNNTVHDNTQDQIRFLLIEDLISSNETLSYTRGSSIDAVSLSILDREGSHFALSVVDFNRQKSVNPERILGPPNTLSFSGSSECKYRYTSLGGVGGYVILRFEDDIFKEDLDSGVLNTFAIEVALPWCGEDHFNLHAAVGVSTELDSFVFVGEVTHLSPIIHIQYKYFKR